MQFVGVRVFVAGQHFADDQSGESPADRFRFFESLDFESDLGQCPGDLFGVQVGFDIGFQPVQ